MAENDTLLNPFGETGDIFAKQATEPLAIPTKIAGPPKKSKMMIIIPIILIILAVVFCCCSLSSYYYGQSGSCKNKDAPREQKNQCNMVGSPSSLSSSLFSILISVGIGMGIYGFVKKDD
jgi:hypothetical protein